MMLHSKKTSSPSLRMVGSKGRPIESWTTGASGKRKEIITNVLPDPYKSMLFNVITRLFH